MPSWFRFKSTFILWSIPSKHQHIIHAILKCKTDAEVEIVGTEWLLKQSKELKAAGVPGLHYYTLGKPHMVSNVVKELV